MSTAARLSLARASRAWQCPSCGKHNEELMISTQGETSNQEKSVELPEELQLAYKDDLGMAKTQSSSDLKTDACDNPSPRCFDTVPSSKERHSGKISSSSADNANVGNRRDTSDGSADRVGEHSSAGHSRSPRVPLWAIDGAIIVVIFLLIAVLMKNHPI